MAEGGGAETAAAAPKEVESKKIVHTYPLVVVSHNKVLIYFP